MPLTRRVQVYISQEASDALDVLAKKLGGQTKAIESALLDAFAAHIADDPMARTAKDFNAKAGEFNRLIKTGADKIATSLDAIAPDPNSGRGKASVETYRPLSRTNATPLPKPGKGKTK